MKKDIYEEVTNQIIEALENGERPWNSPFAVDLNSKPRRATGEFYRGINVLILGMKAMLMNWSNPHWLTFNQAKKIGANVRKNEKSTQIVFYKPWKTIDEESGDEILVPVLRTYRVFNAEQFDNLPDTFSHDLSNLKDNKKVDDVEDFFNSIGADLSHEDTTPHFNITNDKIVIPEINRFISSENYYAVLGHEYIHWTGHHSRLGRIKPANSRNDPAYAFEELVAEIGASFLMPSLGLKSLVDDFHAPYLKGYLSILNDDKKAIFKAAAQAQNAVDYLMDKAELRNKKAA